MCVGRPSQPSPPPPDPSVEAEQRARAEQATETKRTARDETLQKNVTRMRGGTGRRSLIRGGSGGMGYYNEYV